MGLSKRSCHWENALENIRILPFLFSSFIFLPGDKYLLHHQILTICADLTIVPKTTESNNCYPVLCALNQWVGKYKLFFSKAVYSCVNLINKIIFKIRYVQFVCHGQDTKVTKEVAMMLKSVLLLKELKLKHERPNNDQSLGRMFREFNKGNILRVTWPGHKG